MLPSTSSLPLLVRLILVPVLASIALPLLASLLVPGMLVTAAALVLGPVVLVLGLWRTAYDSAWLLATVAIKSIVGVVLGATPFVAPARATRARRPSLVGADADLLYRKYIPARAEVAEKYAASLPDARILDDLRLLGNGGATSRQQQRVLLAARPAPGQTADEIVMAAPTLLTARSTGIQLPMLSVAITGRGNDLPPLSA
ncbi:hypothetical protein BC828DRAFT_374284 [Blastocladiella britannica]|nr:hypothetical protein BC828DRAFT_374284 [Blastocladiella britannica]